MLVLFVKSQLALFDSPINVAAHVRKDGTVVKPHVRIQKVAMRQSSLFGGHHAAPSVEAKPKRTKLDVFLARYGGAAGMAKILAGLPEGQQQQLIAKMAEVGKTTPEALRERLMANKPTGASPAADKPEKPEKPVEAQAKNDEPQRFVISIPLFGDLPYRASGPLMAEEGEVVSSRIITTKTILSKNNARALGLPDDKKEVYAWRVSVVRVSDTQFGSVIEAMEKDHGRSPDGEVIGYFKRVENQEAVDRIAPAIARAALSDWQAAQPASDDGGLFSDGGGNPPETTAEPGPKDGERNAEGLVFRDGRWHREDQPEAQAESIQSDPITAADSASAIVEHTTAKGKTLRGIIRTDIDGHAAAAIDPYTFNKNGGWFIREKHLTGATDGAVTAAAEPAVEVDAEAQARAQAFAAVEKSKAQAAKLREAGEKLLAGSEAEYGRDRNSNTARRARFAASAEAAAAEEIRIAKTMMNLAGAIEDGDARYLAGVSTKAAVKTLDDEVKRAIMQTDRGLSYVEQQRNRGRAVTDADIDNAKFPAPKWGTAGTSLSEVLEAIKGKKGSKDLADKLRSSAGPTPELATQIRKFVEPEQLKRLLGWWNIERLADMNRLQKLGITNGATLREALREFIQYRDGHKAVDPVKAAERALVGQKVGIDFFPTPKMLASSMAAAAGIQPGMRVLEPSAGNGHLADAAKAAGADVDTVEISDTLRNILQAKGHNLAGRDFDDFAPAVQYDAVLMNPPFSDRKDAAHIMRAMDMVKPGGKLVAIAGEGVFFGPDKKAVAFREWLSEHGAEVEHLPPGTFMGADLPAQTGANARLIKITKAAAEVPAPAAEAVPATDTSPKDGDRNADGLVFRDGRWRREGGAAGGAQVFDWSDRESAPVGAWVRADFAVGGDHPVYQVRELPIDSLYLHELDRDGKLQPEKRKYLDGYVERAKSGERPPLITIIEMDDGRMKVADGHRRAVAARGAGLTTIRGLVSPLIQTPDGKKEATESMVVPGGSAAHPAAVPTATDLAEDREDLATELMRNAHSDKAKAMLAAAAGRHAKADTPSDDADDPSSRNYRFADTGHIAGSRKEEAAANVIQRAKRDGAQVLVQNIDWDGLEANPREAKELITKNNLFGIVPWEHLRENGMEPGAGFLIDRVYAAIGQEPGDDNGQARKDYTLGLQTLRTRLESCKTAQQVVDALHELRAEFDGKVLNTEESAAYQKATAVLDPLYQRMRQIHKEMDEHRTSYYAAIQEFRELTGQQDKRIRRGWKPDADIAAKIAQLRPAADAADAEWVEGQNRRNAEERALREQAGAVSQLRNRIEQMAFARNKIENPLHRAWSIMGERFVGVLRYRSHKGSEAFQKHVTAAKTGMVKDWSWLDKGGAAPATRVKKESARFQMRVADRYERVGGRAVGVDSTMALKSHFGLRDVQSGNWVLRDPVSAKFHTEQCAAAFADLADLIGIPDEQVSFNGRLAMAFGARGKGNTGFGGAAAAHYEPVHRVINMTKMSGGGALAHEWFHAVDNLVKEAEGVGTSGVDDFLTERLDLLPAGPLRDAFTSLRAAMMQGEHQLKQEHQYTAQDYRLAQHNLKNVRGGTNAAMIKDAPSVGAALDGLDAYYGRMAGARGAKKNHDTWRRIAIAWHGGNPDGGTLVAKSGPKMSAFMLGAHGLDAGSKKAYYTQPKEMAARAFQSWVEDRMGEMGRKNDYLSCFADNKYHVDPLFGIEWKPFPEGSERDRINKAFDNLMAVMGEKKVLAKALGLL